MRLLNARTITIEEFSQGRIPRYAILSHTWEDDEVSFHDIERQTGSSKAGYAKLLASCKQALLDGLDYVWIDTCCIDKTSSAELSEAINSMFRFYQEADICYAFLSDVPNDTTFDERSFFAKSRWFTRGWTLQELLAPTKLEFYSESWRRLGTKAGFSKIISHVCGIGEPFLVGERPLAMASIAARMSWAAQRETTREEDRAYSLLGIFDAHMPLLYGEGGINAFIRLQEELVRTSDDQTIFAWHWYGPYTEDDYNLPWLASSPSDFLGCHDVVICNRINQRSHFIMTNTEIRMELPIVFSKERGIRKTFAILECRRSTDYWNAFAVPVVIRGDVCIRADPSTVIFDRAEARTRSILFTLHLDTRRKHRLPTQNLILPQTTAMLVVRSLPQGYRIHSVVPPKGWTAWSDTSGQLVHKSDPELPKVCSVITITADDSIDVPFGILCIIVKQIPDNGPDVTKHAAALIDPRSLDLLSDDDAELQSIAFLTSSCQSIRTTGGMMYLRIRPNTDFQDDRDFLEIVFDDSLGRSLKARWAAGQNWITSQPHDRRKKLSFISMLVGWFINWFFITSPCLSWKLRLLVVCCDSIIGLASTFFLGSDRLVIFVRCLCFPMLVLSFLSGYTSGEKLLVLLQGPYFILTLVSNLTQLLMDGQFVFFLHDRAFPLFRIMVYLQEKASPSWRNSRMVDPTWDGYEIQV